MEHWGEWWLRWGGRPRLLRLARLAGARQPVAVEPLAWQTAAHQCLNLFLYARGGANLKPSACRTRSTVKPLRYNARSKGAICNCSRSPARAKKYDRGARARAARALRPALTASASSQHLHSMMATTLRRTAALVLVALTTVGALNNGFTKPGAGNLCATPRVAQQAA
jgi:hypothetical protein